jgi:ankyrin repeat protein
MTSARFAAVFLLSLVVGAGIGCARRPTNSASYDTELLHSARRGDTASVQRLLQHGAHIEAKDQGGSTALALAALFGHSDTVKLLLEKGADPIAGRVNSDDALIEAARLQPSTACQQ